MGIVAFQWEKNQLTLLHNRDHYVYWATKPAAWDEDNKILSGRDENKNGTWCGISRQGRVAFLVDAIVYYDISNAVFFPIDYLKGQMNPRDFVMELSTKLSTNFGVAYHLIVADINSNSMFYISKKIMDRKRIHVEEVGFGMHTLTSAGLDVQKPKDLRLKDCFNEMIDAYENEQLPPMKELAKRFMYDPNESVANDKMSAFFIDMKRSNERYRTTSTTALAVKPTKEVEFYERYLKNGEWEEHDFTFNID